MVNIELSLLTRVHLFYWVSSLGPVPPDTQDVYEAIENAVEPSKEELESIGFKIEDSPNGDGQVRMMWKIVEPLTKTHAVSFETDHAKQLRTLLDGYPAFKHDRAWLKEVRTALKAAL